MKSYKKTYFYVLTVVCAILLGGISTLILDSNMPTQYAIGLALVQMSPLCGLLILCLFNKDFSVFKNLNFSPKTKSKWLLYSILTPIILITTSTLILTYFGSSYIPNGYSISSLVLLTFTSIIGCIGEEIGWRGFLLPQLNKEKSLLASSILTGIFWGAWHFGKISLYGIVGYLLFIILISEFSIIMSWIYANTNKNLFLMIVFHLSINLTSIAVLNKREGVPFYIISCLISAVICLAIVMNNKKLFFNILSTQNEEK